jgi:hypothetical protein
MNYVRGKSRNKLHGLHSVRSGVQRRTGPGSNKLDCYEPEGREFESPRVRELQNGSCYRYLKLCCFACRPAERVVVRVTLESQGSAD